MKAVVFRGIGDIHLESVKDPKIKESTDAIVRLTASAICGTDLHMIRGTLPGMKSGTILGHEGVGVVEETGRGVRNLSAGDRVVIPSTIACGNCSYCRAGYYSQCDEANPLGKLAGTAFFSGPMETGSFDGLQAEYARIPFANVGPLKLPDEVTDDQAILLSDIFPTGYFGADLAEIKPGDTVAVFGCGPVGQFVIASAFLMNAGRVIAVDRIQSRLDMARGQGAEAINFDEEHPVLAIRELTGAIGVDRAIDAVGVDADHAERGPAAKTAKLSMKQYRKQLDEIAPKTNPKNGNWRPGARAIAGAGVGSAVAREGGHAVHHRRVPLKGEVVPDWNGHEPEPDRAHGQLQSPEVSAKAGGVGAQRSHQPGEHPDTGRAARVGARCLQSVRRPPGGLGESGVTTESGANGGMKRGARPARSTRPSGLCRS